MGNGNDDISSEEHLENVKTRRGSCLLLELFICVQLFEFYLVTQSFKGKSLNRERGGATLQCRYSGRHANTVLQIRIRDPVPF
jgi:hypothetical protein